MNILTDDRDAPIIFDYSKLKTLTGLSIDEALKALQRKLEDAAYKKVDGGGKELTDIKPAWLTEELTKVFGLCGIGWTYGFGEPEVSFEEKTSRSGREYKNWQADIYDGWLVVRFTDGEKIIESSPIPSTGGSDNEVKEYAVRGAVTNMIGAAASKLNWQLFIYKGQKDAPKEKVVDERPWWIRALEYAKSRPDLWNSTLGSSEAGQKVVSKLMGDDMVGPKGWFMAKAHALSAVQKYTGFKTPEEMYWKDFEKLARIYTGPQALPGETVKDVLFYHYMQPSEWQSMLASIPLQEDFVLDEMTAGALNDMLVVAQSVRKGKKVDTETLAAGLRKYFVAIAEEVSPTSEELVEVVSQQEEIPY